MELSVKEKYEHAAGTANFVGLLNENPILNGIAFTKLIAYGLNIGEEYFYFDYPYSPEVDIINKLLVTPGKFHHLDFEVYKRISDKGLTFIKFRYKIINEEFHIYDISSDLGKINLYKNKFIEFFPIMYYCAYLKGGYYTIQRKFTLFKSEFNANTPDNDNYSQLILIHHKFDDGDIINLVLELIDEEKFDNNAVDVCNWIIANCKNFTSPTQRKAFNSVVFEEINKKQAFKIRNELLEERRKFVAVHKHIIKNFQFRGKLDSLLALYLPPKNKKADEIRMNYINTLIIRDIATESLYSVSQGFNHDSNFFKDLKCDTYLRILDTIHKSATTSYGELEVFEINKQELAKHPLNLIPDSDLIDVFNILANLYSNARKCCNDDKFFISVNSSVDNNLIIEFVNQMPMPKSLVNFLNSGEPSTEVDESKGLYHIKLSLEKLTYINLQVELITNKQTRVVINVKGY